MTDTKIGFIGLGKMGIPMVNNLLKATYQVAVYNRDQLKVNQLQGVLKAENPFSLVQISEIIILMVADDEAIRSLFKGENGLLMADLTGKFLVNMSTVSPGISKEMALLVADKGGAYLDAPVSGSLKQAQEGSLVMMVGGAQEVFEKMNPIWDVLGKKAVWMGEVGAGNTAKLAINALLSFHALGLAEALKFSEQQGLSTVKIMEVVNEGALGNPFMKIKGEAILQANYQPAFTLKHICKDLRLAENQGLKSPLATAALQTFANAESDLAEEDLISIFKKL